MVPLVGVVALVFVYVRGVEVLWRRAGVGGGIGRPRVAAFLTGAAALAVALVSPLEALAHLTFSMHMVQHVLLVLVAPPLLVAGSAPLALLWALPRGGRRRVGRIWRRAPGVRRVWHGVTGPLAVWCITTTVLWVWHLPTLYEAALVRPWLHALEHATLLGSACLLWWVVLQPMGRPRTHGGAALLLVFGVKVQSTVLAAMITFAPAPLYPLYASGTEAAGRTLLEDQQLAGVIMGWPMALVYFGAAALVFLAWLRSVARRTEAPGVAARARAPRVGTDGRSPSPDLY